MTDHVVDDFGGEWCSEGRRPAENLQDDDVADVFAWFSVMVALGCDQSGALGGWHGDRSVHGLGDEVGLVLDECDEGGTASVVSRDGAASDDVDEWSRYGT
jgi:hypothetical protein